jgi:acyl-coenzyme A synthetase/AMP-(fatty) acid ligase
MVMNIVEPILHQCRINAEQPAICAPGTRFDLISYAQLEHMINNMTRAMMPFSFEPGQVVGVLLQDKIFHIALLLALTRMGLATVSCSGASLPPEIKAVAAITDRNEAVMGAKRVIRASLDWIEGSGDKLTHPRPPETHPDDLCRIILTSGSTGTPKAVAFTHGKLIEKNARLDYCHGYRFPQSSRLFCDLGLSSSQGFRYLVHKLSRGGMVMVFGQDSTSTLQSLNLFEMQSMMTSPFGLAEYLKAFESEPTLHCNFDHILVSGGMLIKNLADRAQSRICENLICIYGATEVGEIATADVRLTMQIPGAVGYVLPDAQVQIVNSSGELLPPGSEGVVRVRTDQAVTGYFGDPETSTSKFRDGWFYPGDYGYLANNGLLVITGREETRLNVGGNKINPETIESVLTAFPTIRDAAVVAIPNALGIEEIYALVRAETRFDEGALRAHCNERLARSFVPVRFIAVNEIPRNEMGKIQRGGLYEIAKSKVN